ncbi:MAG: AAA family ATPase, partial [Deltaproteobacteria bacterium]|nr:AAA family ATPase [Deltaproteobacteria bacterium]
FDQARQSKHQLVNKITSANGNLRGQFFMGHAVCFPDVNKRLEHLRPDSDPSLILDQADLGQLPDRLRKALTFWNPKKTRPTLGPVGIRALRNTLAKDFFLPERLANIIAANEPQILRLTEEQVYILDVLSGTPRARIIGGAGTGKTMLALEKARRLGAEGKKTLLTCYNVALENHLKRIAGGMEGVQVMRFHELCVWAARQCGLPVRVLAPQENDARYWKEELPQVLEQALASSRLEKFDALVVDEGQDLSDTFWYPLLLALKEPDKSTLYVFRDDQQQLYGQGGDLISELPSFPLSQNLRNSQAIYQLASQFEQQLPSTAKGPQGKPVEWVVLEDKGRLMDTLTEVVARLIRQDQLQPEQIALLTGRRPDHYGIDGSTMLGKVPLAPSESPRKGHLTFSTIHRFKGLEAPVIILTGLGDIYQNKESMLYVALTRARHHLVIVDTPEILSKLNPSKR